jgi:hypothetical protein
MSTITKESIADTIEGLEHLANSGIQSVYIDMAIAGMRRLLASLEAEPVITVGDDGGDALAYRRLIQTFAPGTKLFTAPPAPVSVPDESAIFDAAIDICRKSDAIDEHAWNHGVLAVMSAFSDCRGAMLQGADGNSPVISDGWVACSERMPENGEKVLTSFRGGMRTAVCKVVDVLGHKIFVDELTLFNGVPADYWQPLPAAPQQEVK